MHFTQYYKQSDLNFNLVIGFLSQMLWLLRGQKTSVKTALEIKEATNKDAACNKKKVDQLRLPIICGLFDSIAKFSIRTSLSWDSLHNFKVVIGYPNTCYPYNINTLVMMIYNLKFLWKGQSMVDNKPKVCSWSRQLETGPHCVNERTL